MTVRAYMTPLVRRRQGQSSEMEAVAERTGGGTCVYVTGTSLISCFQISMLRRFSDTTF